MQIQQRFNFNIDLTSNALIANFFLPAGIDTKVGKTNHPISPDCDKIMDLRGRFGFDDGYKTSGACRDGDQSR